MMNKNAFFSFIVLSFLALSTSTLMAQNVTFVDILNQEEQGTEKALEMIPMNYISLRALDKITGRTQTFDAKIDEVLKFGSLFIRVRACNKSLPTDKPESASFLQVWEETPEKEPEWVFSNWMFASNPALSAMEHPIYDVWVLSCKKELSKSDSEE